VDLRKNWRNFGNVGANKTTQLYSRVRRERGEEEGVIFILLYYFIHYPTMINNIITKTDNKGIAPTKPFVALDDS